MSHPKTSLVIVLCAHGNPKTQVQKTPAKLGHPPGPKFAELIFVMGCLVADLYDSEGSEIARWGDSAAPEERTAAK